jgi:hypothetical protein
VGEAVDQARLGHALTVAEVAVDVVAGEQEQLRLVGEDRLPDRLRLLLVRAGAERDARQRPSRRRLRQHGRRRSQRMEAGDKEDTGGKGKHGGPSCACGCSVGDRL